MPLRQPGSELLQINRPLFGTDDLVGGKSWTTRPHSASGVVQLSYDARADFLANRQGVITAGTTINAVGSFGTLFTVPATVAYWLHRLTGFSNVLAAGNTLGIACSYSLNTLPPGAGLLQTIGPQSRLAAVGEHCYASMECGFWLPPGAAIGLQVWNFAGAGIPTSVIAHVTPIPV